jgi:Phosphotransferase enzyme family
MSNGQAALAVNELRDHPAVRAWGEVESERIPASVEVLNADKRRPVFRLSGVGPAGRPVIAKRRKRGRLDLEHHLYSNVLSSLPVPTLEMYGFVEVADADAHSWIFLEDAGDLWYEPQSLEYRALAIQWLAELHTQSSDWVAQIPDRGPRYFRSVADDVINGIRASLGHPELSDTDACVLRAIASHVEAFTERWDDVEAVCAAAPLGLVHGDFVSKNVRIRRRHGAAELIAFDWETAGAASPAGDIACLTEDVESLRRYHALVRRAWPGLNQHVVERMARTGRLFRLLHYVYWEAFPEQLETWGRRCPWIDLTMSKLEIYERMLRAIVESSARRELL